MKFLILLAQTNTNFRCAELRSIAEYENIEVDLSSHNSDSPFLTVELPDEATAHRLIAKSILAKSVYRIYCEGPSIEDVWQQASQLKPLELKGKSFKVEFETFQGTREESTHKEVFEKLFYSLEKYLDGPVRLKNPDNTLVFLENYDIQKPKEPAQYTWFTRLVTRSDRSAMDRYNLKKRKHIGTTSFDAELSLVTANMAHVRPGKLVYDPFSGTGSFPLAAAHFGGLCFASDIDYRSLGGYEDNFKQYGTSKNLAMRAEMDFTHNSIRQDIMFDSIICDPPYGVRERIIVCGAAKPERFVGKENVIVDGELAHRRRDYCATKKPYPMSKMLADLLEFAANRLVTHGRLAFWLPVDYEQPIEAPPQHKHLKHIESCVQHFGKWERWLLVYSKRPEGEEGQETAVEVNDNFRDNYMKPRRL